MKRFLLYGHGGSYNHGAEAIVKTTIKLIREKYPDAWVGLSSHFPEQDRKFNVDADEFFAPVPDIWAAERRADSIIEKKRLAREMYASALNAVTPDTVLLSVGGDNFCYPNWHRLAVFQEEAERQNAKSILWGCSVEPLLITPEMADVLSSYTHILARESITCHALRERGINTDIQLSADPAFRLEPEPVDLPEEFRAGSIIGINLSPLVRRRESIPGILMANIRNLIDFILSETDMNIALIPHVVMPTDNDYEILRELEQSLQPRLCSRVWLVGEKLSAAEYKYVISKCRLLVCTRTHASIAAYSTGVPVLVVGYSVKATGIARDLGREEFVLDISDIKSPDCVKGMFQQLYDKTDGVRNSY